MWGDSWGNISLEWEEGCAHMVIHTVILATKGGGGDSWGNIIFGGMGN